MEYKIKYERLVKLYQDSLEGLTTANKSAEVHQNGMQYIISAMILVFCSLKIWPFNE